MAAATDPGESRARCSEGGGEAGSGGRGMTGWPESPFLFWRPCSGLALFLPSLPRNPPAAGATPWPWAIAVWEQRARPHNLLVFSWRIPPSSLWPAETFPGQAGIPRKANEGFCRAVLPASLGGPGLLSNMEYLLAAGQQTPQPVRRLHQPRSRGRPRAGSCHPLDLIGPS